VPEKSGHIRSIARALQLLNAMNEKQPCSLAELHLATGLPKPTVHRILATLQQEGYVKNERGLGQYRVTERTRRLGAAYGEKSQVVDIGAPLILKVTAKIKWPLAIGTLVSDSIVVRYSTMPYSPLAVQATTLGHRLGLLESAMGLAYLAYCEEAERRILLDMLRGSAPGGTLEADDAIRATLAIARQRGYGLRLPKTSGASATVAVPILSERGVGAVLSMTTFGRMMTEQTLATYVPILQTTAREISQAVATAGRVPIAS
jgi:IclR family mhp operon transcriptional activator